MDNKDLKETSNTKLKALYASTIFMSAAGNMLARETNFLPSGLESFFNSGYTNEFSLPFSMFFSMKLFNEGIDPQYNTLGSSIQRGFIVFSISSLLEAAQYFTGIGTYDTKDFLAYAAGAGLAMIVNELSFRR